MRQLKCVYCGKAFTYWRIIKYCSNYCKNKINRERHSEYIKNYMAEWSKKNKRKRHESYWIGHIKWKLLNPEKVQASIKLNNAVKLGKIIKPKNCFQCNKKIKLSAHHNDYNKPLDVIWLCYSCHKQLHNNLKNKNDKYVNKILKSQKKIAI